MTRERAAFTHDELQCYVDGELDAAKTQALDHALARDPELLMQVEALRSLHGVLQQQLLAPADEVDFSGLSGRVLAQIEEAHAGSWSGRLGAWWHEQVASRRAVWVPSLALAAAAALVLTLPRVLDREVQVQPEIIAANEGVEVRSLETGTSLAMVYQLPRSHTTVIWISDRADDSAATLDTDEAPTTEWGGQ
ncbi:MAG: hypothetical protein ABIJ09_24895 [Pseudomonadota bacterium]